jgi:hypothetical protein
MALLSNLNQPGRFDLIRGNATLPLFCGRFSAFNSTSTPRRIKSFTEQPRRAAFALSWR